MADLRHIDENGEKQNAAARRISRKSDRDEKGGEVCQIKRKRLAALALALVMCSAIGLPCAASGADAEQETAQTGAEVTTSRFAQPDISLTAKSAILMAKDTGDVLFVKEPDLEVPMASITKVMTLILTFEAIDAGKISLTDIVPVSEHAYAMGGSQIWLEPGEQFTLDEMIKAICVSSANDAAVAVAEFVGGSEPVFAEMMNKKAAELGMTHSHFVNACGLDTDGHYSSARDVAIMSRELLCKHPQITDYTQIWMDSLRNGETQLLNTNKLLKQYAGINGLKTGTTGKAGVCISASAERDGLSLIAVVLGCPSSKDRFNDATALLDYGFANFESAPFPDMSAAPTELPVTGGAAETVPLTYALPERILVKKGEGSALTRSISLPEKVEAPVAKDAGVGTVTVAVGGETLGNWPINAGQEVQEMDFLTALGLLWNALTTV